MSRDGRGTNAAPVALIGVLAIGVALAIAQATGHGPTIGPDGVSYMRMADRLAPLEHPPGHFPEGYPIVLATMHWLGFGAIGAGRWLGVGLAAVNVVLGALVARRMAGPWWALLVALALVAATTITPLYASINSEPLMITCVLGWLLLIDSQRSAVVAGAGVLAVGTAFVRYAGVAVVVAGVLTLWGDRRRVRAFVVGAAGALFVWGVSRVAWGGGDTRGLAWHPPSRAELRDALALGWTWATGFSGPPLIGTIIIVGAMAMLWRARRLHGGRAIALAALCYAVVLALTVLFIDAQTPLDERLLAPFLVLVLLALPALSTVRGSRVLALGVLASIILNAGVTRHRFDPLSTGMIGQANASTLVAARKLDAVAISNAPGVLWLLTGKEVRWIPEIRNRFTDAPTPSGVAALNRLRTEVRGGYLVWLNAYNYRTYLPTEQAVANALDARLVERFPDGAVYSLSP
jgi:hypothetical protein